MLLRVELILLLGSALAIDRETHIVDTSTFHRCAELIRNSGGQPPTAALSGFPGTGYDGLLSQFTIPVYEVSYSKCKVTPDGKYFLPDRRHSGRFFKADM